jgi:YVTN family beta-propeller protein
MWLFQRYHRSNCSRGATITAWALVVGLMAVLPGCGSPPHPGPTGQPPVAALMQAPALPGAQPISANDRVYTADQDSNTVTVIDPKTTTVLGTIPLGKPRMDTNADVLGAMYDEQIGVHGLGFSRDGQYLNVIDVTTNAVHVIDTATNAVVHTIYVGRAPHEGIVKLLTWCGAARIGRLWRLRRGTRATGIRSRSSGTRCGCITVSR